MLRSTFSKVSLIAAFIMVAAFLVLSVRDTPTTSATINSPDGPDNVARRLTRPEARAAEPQALAHETGHPNVGATRLSRVQQVERGAQW